MGRDVLASIRAHGPTSTQVPRGPTSIQVPLGRISTQVPRGRTWGKQLGPAWVRGHALATPRPSNVRTLGIRFSVPPLGRFRAALKGNAPIFSVLVSNVLIFSDPVSSDLIFSALAFSDQTAGDLRSLDPMARYAPTDRRSLGRLPTDRRSGRCRHRSGHRSAHVPFPSVRCRTVRLVRCLNVPFPNDRDRNAPRVPFPNDRSPSGHRDRCPSDLRAPFLSDRCPSVPHDRLQNVPCRIVPRSANGHALITDALITGDHRVRTGLTARVGRCTRFTLNDRRILTAPIARTWDGHRW